MLNLLFALVISGGLALALSLAYLAFCMFLYVVYRLDGGKNGFISYLNKM